MVDHFGKAYVNGNFVEGHERVSKDNWDGGVQPDAKSKSRDAVLAEIRVNEPFKHAPLQVQSAKEAYEYVLANVGATLPRRDAVDERILKEVRTGVIPPISIAKGSTEKAKFYGYAQQWQDELASLVPKGFVTAPSEVGGWPDYKGTPYQDTDGDGLPDAWEKQHGLDPTNSSDASADADSDGYTNIEEFLNSTDPQKAVDYADLANNK